MPGRQRFPIKRPKPHENGVLAFTTSWEIWAPRPTESEARQHFQDFRPSTETTEPVTVRLILRGSVIIERLIAPDAVG